jgi:hypothetical protein
VSHNLSITVSKVEVEPSGYREMSVDITVENYDAVLEQIENEEILKYVEHNSLVNSDWCLERLTIQDCINHFGLLEMKDEVVKQLIYD